MVEVQDKEREVEEDKEEEVEVGKKVEKVDG